jgi:hypothetical protein
MRRALGSIPPDGGQYATQQEESASGAINQQQHVERAQQTETAEIEELAQLRRTQPD